MKNRTFKNKISQNKKNCLEKAKNNFFCLLNSNVVDLMYCHCGCRPTCLL